MQHLHYPSPGLGTFLTHIANVKILKCHLARQEMVSVTESNESRAQGPEVLVEDGHGGAGGDPASKFKRTGVIIQR